MKALNPGPDWNFEVASREASGYDPQPHDPELLDGQSESLRRRVTQGKIPGFTYPNIRREEILKIDTTDGSWRRVRDWWMVANHILIMTPQGFDEEAFQEQLPGNLRYYSTGDFTGMVRFTDSGMFESVFNQLEAILGPEGTVEPDYLIESCSRIPNDPFFPANPTYSRGQWALREGESRSLSLPIPWDLSTGSKEVIVAVIDTGIEMTHDDLAPNIWVNTAEEAGLAGEDDDSNSRVDDIRGWDFAGVGECVDGEPPRIGDPNPSDTDGHGTQVAGIIGAKGNNGIGIAGVCWDVSLMNLKIFPDSEDEKRLPSCVSIANEAIDYAVENDADIINCSWGVGAKSDILEVSIENAGDKGVIIVASGGNFETPATIYPAGFTGGHILGVAALEDGTGQIKSNTSSDYIDLVAPGDRILTTKPENQYDDEFEGTSAAAAVVSGCLALIKSAGMEHGDDLSPIGLVEVLRQNLVRDDQWSDLLSTEGCLDMAWLKQDSHNQLPLTEALYRRNRLAAGLSHGVVVSARNSALTWAGDFGRLIPTEKEGLPRVSAAAGCHKGCAALDEDGFVWWWGILWGTGSESFSPVQVTDENGFPLGDIRQIDAGDGFFVALDGQGSIYTWGQNRRNGRHYGQLGFGAEVEELAVATRVTLDESGSPLPPMQSVAAGRFHVLALSTDGRVFAWGTDGEGGVAHEQDLPQQVDDLPGKAVAVAASWHSMALLEEGQLYSWGSNSNGALGVDELPDWPNPGFYTTPQLVAVEEDVSFRFIEAGQLTGYAIDDTGQLWVWGDNSFGQFGNGDNADALKPVRHPDFRNVLAVDGGREFTILMMANETVLSCGSAEQNQLGIATGYGSLSHPYDPGMTGVGDAALGTTGGGPILTAVDGNGFIWETGPSGFVRQMFPDQGRSYFRFPTRIDPALLQYPGSQDAYEEFGAPLKAPRIADAPNNYYLNQRNELWSTALDQNWAYECRTMCRPTLHEDIEGLVEIIPAQGNGEHVFAIDTMGRVTSWIGRDGTNSMGQLGYGDNLDRPRADHEFLIFPGAEQIVKVAASQSHALALDENDKVYSWGNNDVKQLGHLSPVDQAWSATPTQIAGLPKIVDIAAGGNSKRDPVDYFPAFSLAVDDQGRLWGWGSNSSMILGEDAMGGPVPVIIEGIPPITRIEAGLSHAMAWTADGRILTWGQNREDQLGNGGGVASGVPTEVQGINGAIAEIQAYNSNCLVRLEDGTVRVWGSNWKGGIAGDGIAFFTTPNLIVSRNGVGVGLIETPSPAVSVAASGSKLQGQDYQPYIERHFFYSLAERLQEDFNGNGIPDLFEDGDGDGIIDIFEIWQGTNEQDPKDKMPVEIGRTLSTQSISTSTPGNDAKIGFLVITLPRKEVNDRPWQTNISIQPQINDTLDPENWLPLDEEFITETELELRIEYPLPKSQRLFFRLKAIVKENAE